MLGSCNFCGKAHASFAPCSELDLKMMVGILKRKVEVLRASLGEAVDLTEQFKDTAVNISKSFSLCVEVVKGSGETGHQIWEEFERRLQECLEISSLSTEESQKPSSQENTIQSANKDSLSTGVILAGETTAPASLELIRNAMSAEKERPQLIT